MSNHLILRNPPGPFHYLEKVAVIEDGGGNPRLSWYEKSGRAIVYYELLSQMSAGPDVRITYRMDGRTYRDVSRQDLAAEMSATLHPAWFRKWFLFQQVVLDRPEPCNV